MEEKNVQDVFIQLLAESADQTEDFIRENRNEDMEEKLGVTSVELFPLLSGLEDAFNIDLDYAGFLTNVKTVNQGIEYITNMIKGENKHE